MIMIYNTEIDWENMIIVVAKVRAILRDKGFKPIFFTQFNEFINTLNYKVMDVLSRGTKRAILNNRKTVKEYDL